MFLGGHPLGSKKQQQLLFFEELGKRVYGDTTSCIFQGPRIISYINYIFITVIEGKQYFGEFTFYLSHQLHQHFTEICLYKYFKTDTAERGSCTHSLPVIKNQVSA